MEGVLPDNASSGDLGHLEISGCDAVALAERFGTPLIVFDKLTFEARARSFAAALAPQQVCYAGKAFLCVAVCQLVDKLGLSLDVCSGGELATAQAAGFPAERVLFHGNNKSVAELEQARDAGVGRLVADSIEELGRIADLDIAGKLLLRVTPGVEAHTHEFVQTGQEDSKFGLTLAQGVALEGLKRAIDGPGEVVGVHAHIGSQIFELAAFDLAVRRLATFLQEAKNELGFEALELNLGGGFGIAHTRDELTPDPTDAVKRLVALVEREFEARELDIPSLFVEPGRAIVGSAAVTLYEVGTVKTIPGVRTYVSVDGGMSDDTYQKGLPTQTDRVYVSVDGGMSDNPRYPLYGARYEAFLANRMRDEATLWTTVAGKHCESGDILIKDVRLPSDVGPGDLLCIPATGAYTYSMAGNYNRVPRPAVVMVHRGEAKEIIRRETHEDLLRLDCFS
jgi:diaminopimelate decarboxylase